MASPIYLPLTAVLVDAFGLRPTLRIEAGTVLVTFLLAALAVPTGRLDTVGRPQGSVREALRLAWHTPGIRSWVAASLIGGAGIDALLTWQVPIMVAGGLPVAVAATIAGLRGLTQLDGRLPLGFVLKRLGACRTLLAAHVLAALAAVLLFASGHLLLAVSYAMLAGVATGGIGSLQGIYKDLVDPAHLGMLFGAQQAVFGIGGAAGPALLGLLLAATGPHQVLIFPILAGFLAATVVLLRGRPRGAHGVFAVVHVR